MTNKSFLLSILLLLITTAVVVIVSQRGVPVVIRTNLERIPMHIAGYLAVENSFSDAVYEELNADKHVYRFYTDPEGAQLALYIGYYGTAKGGRTPHNPYSCLPSQGWAILDTGVVTMQTHYAPDGVNVNYMVSTNNGRSQYIIHWYQSAQTKVLDNGIKRNIQRFIGKIAHNRNDGAYVQVSTSRVNSTSKELPEKLIQFTQEILDLLPEYWPEEQ